MTGLLRSHAGFRRLWIGDGLSKIGSQVTLLAVPVLAATALGASTWQVALLSTCAYAPLLLIGLPVGAWADRLPRRRVLVGADLARAAALVSVPVAAMFDRLSLGQLYVVEFLVGLGTVVFDVFQRAYVPGLVGRGSLAEANGRLELNRTVGFTAGPAVGGQLVGWLGAATATVASAVGFLWSALWISLVRAPEPRPGPPAQRHLVAEIREGLRFVLAEPFIRATTLYGCAAVACLATRYAVETLFLLRTVGLAPAWIGALVMVTGIGSIAGAVASAPLARRLGEVRVVAWSAVAMGASSLLIPLTGPGWALIPYGIGGALVTFWITVNSVVGVSRSQRLCPDHLLGRVNATSRFVAWATLPLGGVLGGLLGTVLTLRGVLWVTAVGLVLSSVLLVRALRGDADVGDAGGADRAGAAGPGRATVPLPAP